MLKQRRFSSLKKPFSFSSSSWPRSRSCSQWIRRSLISPRMSLFLDISADSASSMISFSRRSSSRSQPCMVRRSLWIISSKKSQKKRSREGFFHFFRRWMRLTSERTVSLLSINTMPVSSSAQENFCGSDECEDCVGIKKVPVRESQLTSAFVVKISSLLISTLKP